MTRRFPFRSSATMFSTSACLGTLAMKTNETFGAVAVLLTALIGAMRPASTQAQQQQPRRGGVAVSGPAGQPDMPTSPAPPLGGSSLGGFDRGQGGLTSPAPPLGGSTQGGFRNPNEFGTGGLSRAFVPQPQPFQSYGAPVRGQAYQIPSQFAGWPPGTVVTWGRYRYRLGGDGTMTSAGPIPGQAYQIPPEYVGQPPGTVVAKGRFRYQIGGNGTMTAYFGPEPTDAVQTSEAPRGPIPGERYQLPSEHAGVAPGTVLNYQGSSYVVGRDGTMTALGEAR